jgi:hypothetical protein
MVVARYWVPGFRLTTKRLRAFSEWLCVRHHIREWRRSGSASLSNRCDSKRGIQAQSEFDFHRGNRCVCFYSEHIDLEFVLPTILPPRNLPNCRSDVPAFRINRSVDSCRNSCPMRSLLKNWRPCGLSRMDPPPATSMPRPGSIADPRICQSGPGRTCVDE